MVQPYQRMHLGILVDLAVDPVEKALCLKFGNVVMQIAIAACERFFHVSSP
tara:strand:- start:9864 stop:10016 length:153 start_codon:yes stop_codon:yes gene_type:complete